MKFEKVIGQHEIKTQLLEESKNGRLSHARLFTGKEGVGKLPLALALAQYVNCKNPGDDDSCGVCTSCVKYQKLIHPDLHFVFPIIKNGNKTPVCDDFIDTWRSFVLDSAYVSQTNWAKYLGIEKKQALIYDEESAQIIKKLSRKSYEGKYKIVIIWQPEKMTASCANKLLKILEEPPRKTLFIMLSENPRELLPTILSRTQMLHVPKIKEELLFEYLKTNGYNSEVIHSVLPLAEGSVTKALKLIEEQNTLQFNFEEFKNLMRFSYARNMPELYDWTEKMSKIGRENQKLFLDYATRMIRENFMFNLNSEDLYRVTSTESEFSEKFSPFINPKNVEGLYRDFSEAYGDISSNGNPKIIFMDLFIQVVRKIKLK